MINKLRGAATAFSYAYSLRGISVNPLETLLFTIECVRKGAFGNRTCRFRKGKVRFSARSVDWCAIDEVMRCEEYGFVRGILEGIEVPVIYDLGANVGLFALYVLSLFPRAKILSVEASKDTLEILRQNIAANPGLEWNAVHAAIWKENGDVGFCPAKYSTGSRVAFGGGGIEKVPAMRLDSLFAEFACKEGIHLMKMDIEGAEQAALLASESILERIGTVVVEVHPPQSDQKFVAELLARHFGNVYSASGRKSSKQLFVAGKSLRKSFGKEYGLKTTS